MYWVIINVLLIYLIISLFLIMEYGNGKSLLSKDLGKIFFNLLLML